MTNKRTTKDILDMSWNEVNNMSQKELAKLTQQIGAVANKRVKRLHESEDNPKVLQDFTEKVGNKVQTKGMNINQLKKTFTQTQKFLNSPESTARGLKRKYENLKSTIAKATGTNKNQVVLSKKEINTYFDLLDRYRDNNPEAVYLYGSTRVMSELYNQYTQGNGQSVDDVYNSMINKMREDTEKNDNNNESEYESFLARQDDEWTSI
jgi:hypothetical protein